MSHKYPWKAIEALVWPYGLVAALKISFYPLFPFSLKIVANSIRVRINNMYFTMSYERDKINADLNGSLCAQAIQTIHG